MASEVFTLHIERDISPEDPRSLRDEKLHKQVQYVCEHSEFYRRKFEQAHISPDDIQTLDDLTKVPFTTKDELRESLAQSLPPGRDMARLYKLDVKRLQEQAEDHYGT